MDIVSDTVDLPVSALALRRTNEIGRASAPALVPHPFSSAHSHGEELRDTPLIGRTYGFALPQITGDHAIVSFGRVQHFRPLANGTRACMVQEIGAIAVDFATDTPGWGVCGYVPCAEMMASAHLHFCQREGDGCWYVRVGDDAYRLWRFDDPSFIAANLTRVAEK